MINGSKSTRVLNRLASRGSMKSTKLKSGSSINASKPLEVLNRLVGTWIILAWYQDKPAGVLNRIARSRAISGKEVWLMHYYAHDS